MKWILRLLISTLAILAASYLITGIKISDFKTALIVAVVLAVLNTLVKPILILFTIPVTIFTLGLFLLVINGAIIMIASYAVEGFKVDTLFNAILFSIIVWIINMVLQAVFNTKKKDD